VTLRAKLLLTVLGLVAIALIVSDIASAATLHSYLLRQTDKEISEARVPFRRVFNSSTTTTVPNPTSSTASVSTSTSLSSSSSQTSRSAQQFISDYFIQLRTPSGAIESQYTPTVRDSQDPIPDLPQSLVTAHLNKSAFTVRAVGTSRVHYRVIVSKTPSGDTLITAVTTRNIDSTIHSLRNIDLAVSLIILIALGLAAWGIVRAELRQLDRIAATAGAIAAGDLSQRIDTSRPSTEVGRLSEALNAMLTQIEASFAEKQTTEDRLRRFAADASHELRTPLTAIRGYAELFRQGAIKDDEHLTRVLQRIESEALRMGLMVDDLLMLARLDQSRSMERESVDVVGVVRNVVNDSMVVSTDQDIALTCSVDTALVNGDPARLHQVFSNLVGNAMVHTPAGTSIAVSVRKESGWVVVDVKDDGPGLSTEAAGRIFERFFRVDTGRSRHTGGTGLGLSIVKSIVDSHEGEVSVATKVGRGACFTVRLPLSDAKSDQEATSNAISQ
jgi:two-component system, OmpR family, sensor kinase